jgi:hypothetical protein
MNNNIITELVQLLNDGAAVALRRKLGQQGEVVCLHLLTALTHDDCKVTIPGALSLLTSNTGGS